MSEAAQTGTLAEGSPDPCERDASQPRDPIVRDTRVPTCSMHFSPGPPVGPNGFVDQCGSIPQEPYSIEIYLEEICARLEIIFVLRHATVSSNYSATCHL